MRDLINSNCFGWEYCRKWYIQTADIDLENEQWTPIGKNFKDRVQDALPYFAGSYDGNYHIIKGLNVSEKDKMAGLFGRVVDVGTIKNLEVHGTIKSEDGDSVGGIAGEMCWGTIENCCFIGDVSGTLNGIGGIVGYIWIAGTVKNCYHIGSVTNTDKAQYCAVGGITGRINVGEHGDGTATIENCYHVGKVSGADDMTGALVGCMRDVGNFEADIYIRNCYTHQGDCNYNITSNGKATECDILVQTTSQLKKIAEDLGKAFCDDTEPNMNSGYPVLSWQVNAVQPIETPENPIVSYEKGDGLVKLTWTKVSGAEKYGIAGYVNGSWQNLAECSETSYTLKALKAGTNYKVAVITKVNGTWNKDFSNAIIVTPNKDTTNQYPVVTSEVSGRQFRLKWTAVDGAEKYGIAVYQSSSWRVKVQFKSNTMSYTSPKMKSGTYKMVVCAKVNGNWNISNIKSRAFTVKIS